MREVSRVWKIILIIVIKLYSSQECNKECIFCLNENLCGMCNFMKNYYLNENTCMLKQIANCAIYNEKGECEVCETNYYLDQRNDCNKIFESSVIEHCKQYLNLYECKYCELGYILNEGKCQMPQNFIQNCLIYDTEDPTLCKNCLNGFHLDETKKICSAIKLKENCGIHSNYECVKCKEGYFLDRNYYLENIFDFDKNNALNIFFSVLNYIKTDKFGHSNYGVCKNVFLENCKVLNPRNFKECETCKSNYYLTPDLRCEKYPVEPIPFCMNYETENKCERCHKDYFMETFSKCSPIIKINKCLEYNRSTPSPTQICESCEIDYFLQNGTCVLRQIKIDFCFEYSVNSEKCQKCFPDFILNGAANKCIHKISNCKKYVNINDDPVVCDECEDKYFYDIQKKFCVAGNILKCEKYKKNENLCEICANSYFFNNGVCEKHEEIKKCEVYHQFEKNKCQKCLNSSILFYQNNTCVKKNVIKNCLVYDDSQIASKCELCSSGFVVDQNGMCEESTDLNCQKKNTDCIKCKNNMVLNTITKKCVYHYYFLRKDCEKFEETEPNSFNCVSCIPKSYPINLEGGDVCIPNNSNYFIPVNFCDRYKLENNTSKCVECISPLTLNLLNQTCSSICLMTKVIVTLNFLPNNKTMKKSKNECLEVPTLPNCEMAIQSSNSQNLICFLCKANQNGVRLTHFDFSPTSITRTQHHIAEYRNRAINSLIYNPLNKMEPVLCGHTNNFPIYYNTDTNNTPIQNCEMFELFVVNNQNIYKCVKCKIGFIGVAQAGYIDNCTYKIDKCDTTLYLKNLEISNFESPLVYASCYACLNNLYPVMYIQKSTTRFLIAPFGLDQTIPSQGKTVGVDKFMKCASLTNLDFNLKEIDIFDSIPEKCGFILYYVDKEKKADKSDPANLSIVCGGCKPGYKPVLNSGIIFDCIEIVECDLKSSNNVFFNSCGECQKDFTFKFHQDLLYVDNSECVSNPEYDSCEIYNTANNKCAICKNGFLMNKDLKCERINLASCSYNKFVNSKLSYSPSYLNYAYSIHKSILGHGCSSCDNNVLRFSTEANICTESNYLATTDINLLENTNFLKNCKLYDPNYTTTFQCKQCEDNFIVLNTGLTCIPMNAILNNCKIASSSSTCFQCQDKFLLLNYVCVVPSILNCQIYENNQTTQICKTCDEGYYLMDNNCILGNIVGCKIYTNQMNCLECHTKHQKVQLNNSNYCYPIPESNNCLQYVLNNFNSFELSCEKCEENYMISLDTDAFENQICFTHHIISHCLHYDFKNNFLDSKLTCIECENSFYLIDNFCEKRKNVDYNCVIFKKDEDICLKCDFGYYLDNSGIHCLIYPQGIYGCVEYTDKSVCSLCKENFYLSENKCLDILPENKIQNCIGYDSSFNCIKCLSNFFAKSKSCEPMIATNCLTASDESNCKTCDDNFGLETLNSTTNCVPINLPNCLISTRVVPFICLQCQQHFYLKNDICNEVSTQIENCLIYDAEERCTMCSENKILSEDRKSCFEDFDIFLKIDPNCYSIVEYKTPVCRICEFGYFIDNNGDCIRCENEACFACNPADNICYICNKEYYQNSPNSNCLHNASITPTPVIDFTSCFKIFILCFVIYFA